MSDISPAPPPPPPPPPAVAASPGAAAYQPAPVVASTSRLWNYASGVICAQAVALVMLLLSTRQLYESAHLLGGSGGSYTPSVRTALVLVAVGTVLAAVAAFALILKAPVGGVIAFVAGVVGSLGWFWPQISIHSAAFTLGDTWQSQAPGLTPVLLGVLALGLRRSHSRSPT